VARDVERRMSEETVEEKPSGAEERPVKIFVVRCEVEHAMGGLKDEFMDTVPAYDEEDAKDFVVGWMAERDFIVKKWIMVGDAERLGRVAKNLNP